MPAVRSEGAVPMTQPNETTPAPSFADKISALASAEAVKARRDPERMSAAIEALASALALLAAAGTGGDPAGMNTMLEGATAYAFERSGDFAKVVRMMGA